MQIVIGVHHLLIFEINAVSSEVFTTDSDRLMKRIEKAKKVDLNEAI